MITYVYGGVRSALIWCVDAVVDSYVAIIILQSSYVLQFPVMLSVPMSSLSTTPSTMPADTGNSVTQTTNGEITTTYHGMSRTTPGVPYESSAPSDHVHVSSNISAEYGSRRGLLQYAVIGPLMYVHFSEDNSISDAGFTVDLLFQHRLYAEVSLAVALIRFTFLFLLLPFLFPLILSLSSFCREMPPPP